MDTNTFLGNFVSRHTPASIHYFAMKPHGTVNELSVERRKALLKAYMKQIAISRSIHLPDICKAVALSPAPRFWVSPMRAAIVISQIRRGDRLDNMRPTTRDMFMEIYRRAISLQAEHPDLTMLAIARKVVESPAPQWYLTPDTVKVLICRSRRMSRRHNRRPKH